MQAENNAPFSLFVFFITRLVINARQAGVTKVQDCVCNAVAYGD